MCTHNIILDRRWTRRHPLLRGRPEPDHHGVQALPAARPPPTLLIVIVIIIIIATCSPHPTPAAPPP